MPPTHRATTRRAWRLRYGRVPSTLVPQRAGGRRPTCAAPDARTRHRRRHRHRHRHRRASHRRGSALHPMATATMGFEWDRQSCWMDSSLMALFFPDEMHKVVFPMVTRNKNPKLSEVKNTVMNIVTEMRASNNTAPHLHGLRTLLADNFLGTRDQKYAFQRENELGYVFYFLQEFLKLFDVDCVRGVPGYYSVNRVRKQYVMEVDQCHGEAFSQCLKRNYRGWKFQPSYFKFMVIELVGKTVKPEEFIEFEGAKWSLCSMIVFDCSHFISYLKQAGQWYLYDDNRSMSHKTLQPYTFGEHYERGSCRFRYGVENTFFFYVRV